jgi:hypothetical protein
MKRANLLALLAMGAWSLIAAVDRLGDAALRVSEVWSGHEGGMTTLDAKQIAGEERFWQGKASYSSQS